MANFKEIFKSFQNPLFSWIRNSLAKQTSLQISHDTVPLKIKSHCLNISILDSLCFNVSERFCPLCFRIVKRYSICLFRWPSAFLDRAESSWELVGKCWANATVALSRALSGTAPTHNCSRLELVNFYWGCGSTPGCDRQILYIK